MPEFQSAPFTANSADKSDNQIRDISDYQNLHTSIILWGMKISFKNTTKILCLMCFAVCVISCSGKSKKNNAPEFSNPMAKAFMNAQNSDKPKDKKAEDKKDEPAPVLQVNPLEIISFNRDKAVVDTGSKSFNERKAIDIVRDMKTGWNLGNTFDATGGGKGLGAEMSWGQPKTTKEMIDGLAASGIKTIRIPVSWSRHIIDNNYTISPEWMSRVKEVVDWAIEDGMYVVLNIHHDNFEKNAKMPALSGFYPTDQNYENSAKFVCNTWAQIALAFNNGYDEHLVFEVLNEPRLVGTTEEWYYNAVSPKSISAMKNLNKLTQNILDVIRASDGNNKKRLVAVPSLQASPESALASTFKMPQDFDGSKDRLIVSIHMYTPYNFAMESPGIKEYSEKVKKEFTSMFKKLNDQFIVNGYAVYIGEYGATNKNNLEDRVAWFHDFIKESRAYGMPCFLWDNGIWKVEDNKYDEHYGYYNRTAQTWYFPEIIKAINEETK